MSLAPVVTNVKAHGARWEGRTMSLGRALPGMVGWVLVGALLGLTGCGNDAPPQGANPSGGTAGSAHGGSAGVSANGGGKGGAGGTTAGATTDGGVAGSDSGSDAGSGGSGAFSGDGVGGAG